MHYLVMLNRMAYSFTCKIEAVEFINDNRDGALLFRYEPEEFEGDGGTYHPLNIEAVRINLSKGIRLAA